MATTDPIAPSGVTARPPASRRSRIAEDGNWDWVEAGPFRAHVRWLVEATGVDPVTVAELAGVPPRLVARLVGQRGRMLRRLPPHLARQLLLITPHGIATLRANQIPAGRVRRTLVTLARIGHGDAELALLTGLDPLRVSRYRLGLSDEIDECTEARVIGRIRAAGHEVEGADPLGLAA